MPIVEVTLVEGRSPEQIRAFVAAITEAATETLNTSRAAVRVVIHQIPPTQFFIAGRVYADHHHHHTDSATTPLAPER